MTDGPATGELRLTKLSVGGSVADQENVADAVASFDFECGGNKAGQVLIGETTSSGIGNLLSATFAGVRVWSVDQTGATFSVSDTAVKEDVGRLIDPLAILAMMRGVSYLSRIDGSLRVGLLAHEIASALPEAVRTNSDGLKAVDYNAVIGVLVEAVKMLTARVEQLSGSPLTR